MTIARYLTRSAQRLALAALGLACLGSVQASTMAFTMSAELNNVVTVGAPSPAPFAWDRMSGVLIGDPVPLAGPNVLDCFSGICEISSMSIDFFRLGSTVAHFDFTLSDPSTQTFSGLMNGTFGVEAQFTEFVYDVFNGQCSFSSDTLCFSGSLAFTEIGGASFLDISWLGWGDGAAPGSPVAITSIVTDLDGCSVDCGSFDVNVVPAPGALALIAFGLIGLGAARSRRPV